MLTLADQLIPLLPQDARDEWQQCGRKQAYPSMDKATAVALHRNKMSGEDLYVYVCPLDQTHFHLTSAPQTPVQIEALETFTASQQRRYDLERRQLRRTIRELDGKILATRGRFRRQMASVGSSLPFPSRITAHYDGLRSLLDEWARYAADLMAAVYAYEGRMAIAASCADFSAPGSAWRAASEAKLVELTAVFVARAEAADEAYEEEMRVLAEMEARDLVSCREALNERYAGGDAWPS